MTAFIIVRTIHFIAIFGLISSLSIEHVLISKFMTRAQIKRIARVDAIYGISALLILTAGLLLWFWVGKPASYYSLNWIFHTKLTLFLVIGLISIYPTVFFIKQQRGDPNEPLA